MALRTWWLCPDCLQGFEMEEKPTGYHWADSEAIQKCTVEPVLVREVSSMLDRTDDWFPFGGKL